jgi:hypothetical protein
MDRLRHIHSKIGSETAFRIPVSVEDAIAEGVEAYDLMRMAAEAEAKRGDELAARVSELEGSLDESIDLLVTALVEPEQITDNDILRYRDVYNRSRSASLLMHDADFACEIASKWMGEAESIGAKSVYADELIDIANELRKQAGELG